jgi:hypothetical protein
MGYYAASHGATKTRYERKPSHGTLPSMELPGNENRVVEGESGHPGTEVQYALLWTSRFGRVSDSAERRTTTEERARDSDVLFLE